MKTIPRFLLVPFLLLAMVSAQEALAGGCSSGKCPFTSVAPSVPPAPAPTASTSRGFTATGGTRVADVNLSPEGLARLAAGDKEEPLPKGCVTAADRAKLFAEPLKPREAKPFYAARRSVARPVKPATAVKVKSLRGSVLRSSHRGNNPAVAACRVGCTIEANTCAALGTAVPTTGIML